MSELFSTMEVRNGVCTHACLHLAGVHDPKPDTKRKRSRGCLLLFFSHRLLPLPTPKVAPLFQDAFAAMEPDADWGPKGEATLTRYREFLAERNALPSPAPLHNQRWSPATFTSALYKQPTPVSVGQEAVSTTGNPTFVDSTTGSLTPNIALQGRQ